MAATKFLDTLSRLRGMAGEARDAVSAETQVHVSEAPKKLVRSPTGRTAVQKVDSKKYF